MNLNPKQVKFLIQQLTLLVVDDNPFMRNLVRNLLLSIGVKTIYEASDGITALDMIRTVKPDVVVLDLEMPMRERKAWRYYGPAPRPPVSARAEAS